MAFGKHIYSVRFTVVIFSALLTGNAPLAAESRNGFDYSNASVPTDEIFWGGVRRDGIPPIHEPKFIIADEADFLRDKDRVLGIVRNGIAKAYPIKILDHHEVVNDKFDDESIVVTYCPLCYSGMAFEVQFSDVNLTFGVSGLLYNSDVLLFDYRTGSLWSQILSEAISGPLKGHEIPAIPTAHTTWRDWKKRHPDTLVLSTDTGFRIRYRGSPYANYKNSSRLMFPVANYNKAYGKKELVLGVKINGAQKAYPFKELHELGESSFGDTLGGTELTIEWQERDKYARAIDSNGEEIPTVIVYWFAWYAFHPGTEIFVATPPKY
ncbi:MAG: DUF3179 domain-containing protein [Proteobacteria bacterium]|nr:DUF3179 domain-containing protein [Pseudomonadota bacterium]